MPDQSGFAPEGYPASADLKQVASTGIGGFALQNATPIILSWTAPNDGQLHRVTAFGALHVIANETGGQINLAYTLPDGQTNQFLYFPGGGVTGPVNPTAFAPLLVEPGSIVFITQIAALSAGAAKVWAEIWAS